MLQRAWHGRPDHSAGGARFEVQRCGLVFHAKHVRAHETITLMAEMTHAQRVSAARDFAARWKDRGAEKSDTQQFWIDLCSNVLEKEKLNI